MNRLVLPFVFFAVSAFAVENSAPVLVPETVLPFGSSPEKFAGKPELELSPQAPEARSGKVYLRKNSQGLIIAGTVTGGAPQFPGTPAEIMEKEHIEIWLAVTPNPGLPAIGWGNQFDDVELPEGEKSCEDYAKKASGVTQTDSDACREFVQKQKSYRAYFTRLFVRQWQLAPGIAVESFAAPAYQTIQERFRPGKDEARDIFPELLKPSGMPQAVFESTSGPAGYRFEVLVPWNVFPPADNETLRDMSVLVEAYGPAATGKKFGAYGTSAPGRRYGNATTFNQIRFAEAREYELTPCDYELVGLDLQDEPTKAFFFPAESEFISDVFILENYKRGYAYGPTGLSPKTRPTHFFWKRLGLHEYVCGPILRHKEGDREKDLELDVHGQTSQVVIEEEKGFDARKLPDGTLLVKDGPREAWSKYGSGACGACPRAFAQFYAITPDLNIKRVFDVFDVIGNEISDMDIQVSPDWTRIAVYRFKSDWAPGREPTEPTWRDQFYCFKDGNYQECGPERHDPAPEPRTLKFEEN
jgi:hypothetical protein